MASFASMPVFSATSFTFCNSVSSCSMSDSKSRYTISYECFGRVKVVIFQIGGQLVCIALFYRYFERLSCIPPYLLAPADFADFRYCLCSDFLLLYFYLADKASQAMPSAR